MINARTAVDGDGAHLFCFRLTFCIHPDKIKKQVNIVGTQVSIQLWWVKREAG